MGNGVSEPLLSELSEFVRSQTGLHFSGERWADLERGIEKAAQEFGFEGPEQCIRWLVSSHLDISQIEILASNLTVGETYFFREANAFDVLESRILPELIDSRRSDRKYIRIWSAGCATGEEPYSLAILLDRITTDSKDWEITVLATDINPRFLEKATRGVYREWSFRNTPSWVKERYFRKRDGVYEILPRIKEMVTYSYLNLVKDAFPSLLNGTNAMDIIFCRNVLMYFDHPHMERVTRKLYRSLAEGGCLFVGTSEVPHVAAGELVSVRFPGITVFKRDSTSPQRFIDLAPEDAAWEPAFEPLEPEVPTLQEPAPLSPEAEPTTVTAEPDIYEGALALYEQGRYPDAAEKLTSLLKTDEGNSGAMKLLARAYANQGMLEKAHEWCAAAIAVDKTDPAYHYLIATIYVEQGENDEAIRSLKRSLYLDPDFVLAHFALGNLLLREGKGQRAEKYLQNALELLKRYPPEEGLPESDGITAGRLAEIISTALGGATD